METTTLSYELLKTTFGGDHPVLENFKNKDDVYTFDILCEKEVYLGLTNGVDLSQFAKSGLSYSYMESYRKSLEKGIDLSHLNDIGFTKEKINTISLLKENGIQPWRLLPRKEFNIQQFHEIMEGIERGVDVSWYAKPEFNHRQMRSILLGLLDGVDVSLYARPEFDYEQMLEIKSGLEDGVDASIYANPELNHLQMGQVHIGLRHKIDVSKYNDSKFTYMQMKLIRRTIETGYPYDTWLYEPKHKDVWNRISNLMDRGIDFTKYMNPTMSSYLIMYISIGLENGIDVSLYADQRYSDKSIKMIFDVLVNTYIDISFYANPEFSYSQMIWLRELVITDESVWTAHEKSVLRNNNYNSTQMAFIFAAKFLGFDTSIFMDTNLNYDDMKKRLNELIDTIDEDSRKCKTNSTRVMLNRIIDKLTVLEKVVFEKYPIL